jgi:predicted RNA polymerase sigma factor
VHSTKTDFYRRLGRIAEALEAFGKALEMSQFAGKTFSAAAYSGIKK